MLYSYKEHFSELKKRLVWTILFFLAIFLLSYYFSEQIYYLLAKPLLDVEKIHPNNLGNLQFIYTSLAETFIAYLDLSFFTAFILTLPFLSFQVYCFIAPGLYKHEKKFLKILLIFSFILLIAAILFVYFIVLPKAWSFFLSFQTNKKALQTAAIVFLPKISEYLALVIKIAFAFAICFQLPVVLIILCLLNIISPKALKKQRRIAIVINFIIAGILTPPDILSQFLLAIPMCALYELAILVCLYINNYKKTIKGEKC